MSRAESGMPTQANASQGGLSCVLSPAFGSFSPTPILPFGRPSLKVSCGTFTAPKGCSPKPTHPVCLEPLAGARPPLAFRACLPQRTSGQPLGPPRLTARLVSLVSFCRPGFLRGLPGLRDSA